MEGQKGVFSYYDKEKQDNIELNLPFTFIVLDTLNTIKGFCKPKGSGFWSNEVRDTTKDKMTLRDKDGIVAEGLYRDIIMLRESKGAKYSQSVYIAFFEGKDLVIGNIQIMGASLNAWIDFRKDHEVMKGAITVKDSKEETNGDNTYQVPIFEVKELSDETNSKAIELDKELQDYLSKYFNAPKEEYTEEQKDAMQGEEETKKRQIIADAPKVTLDDDLPF